MSFLVNQKDMKKQDKKNRAIVDNVKIYAINGTAIKL